MIGGKIPETCYNINGTLIFASVTEKIIHKSLIPLIEMMVAEKISAVDILKHPLMQNVQEEIDEREQWELQPDVIKQNEADHHRVVEVFSKNIVSFKGKEDNTEDHKKM